MSGPQADLFGAISPISLSIVRWGRSQYIWTDEVAALVVVAAILWSGGILFRTSTGELLDRQSDQELVGRVRQAAAGIPGVEAVEKLRVRKTGMECLADVHIQVDAKLSVDEGHRIGHLIKDELVHEFASLRNVLVHLESFPHINA